MSRRLKLLGVATMAVVVFSIAAIAQASAASFNFESTPTWLKGSQVTKNVFTFSGGTVKCSVAEFRSTALISGTSVASVTVHPIYGGCVAFGQSATVNTNSCDYVLSASGLVVSCSGASSITVEVPSGTCSVFIGTQFPTSPKLTYTSSGSGATREFLVTSSVTGLTYGTSGGICGSAGTNGTYTGSVMMAGFASSTFSSQHGAWVS